MSGQTPPKDTQDQFVEVSPEETLFEKPERGSWHKMLPLLLLLAVLVWTGLHFGLDKRVVASGAVIYGILTSAFAWLVGVIGLIPIIGPLIVKVLSIGVIWLLNAIGYLVSYIAIKRGYSKDVLTYRGLTIALITGIVIGYIVGHYV